MRSGDVIVTYGEPEVDPDAAPIYRGTVPFLGGPLKLYPYEQYRRKRFEKWRNEDGTLMGRWTWERY